MRALFCLLSSLPLGSALARMPRPNVSSAFYACLATAVMSSLYFATSLPFLSYLSTRTARVAITLPRQRPPSISNCSTSPPSAFCLSYTGRHHTRSAMFVPAGHFLPVVLFCYRYLLRPADAGWQPRWRSDTTHLRAIAPSSDELLL